MSVISLLLFWKLVQGNSEQPLAVFSHPYTVAPNIVAIEIEPESVIHATQAPYQAHTIDRQQSVPGNNPWIIRGWKTVGSLVGRDQNVIYGFDHYAPQVQIREAWLDQPQNYSVQAEGDRNYQKVITPTAVYRKSKPVDIAKIGPQETRWPMQHTLYLDLPLPLMEGQKYTLQFAQQQGKKVEPLTFQYAPLYQTSEAIHVSQIGFRPDDPLKVGFLSTWMGTGGNLSYSEDLNFDLIDDLTHQSVFSDSVRLRKRRDATEDNRGQQYTLTDVYELDFSSFNQSGHYRLCVQGIGCSKAFGIAANVWQAAFYTAMQGFYHQRSGIALGPPHTDFQRPRPFHPDDGLVVYQSTTPLVDTGNGLNARGTDSGNFSNLLQGKTDEVVTNVWGGYFDAGDWDRRIQHLGVARKLLELLELFPTAFEAISLNLPESTNTLPDLFDEALWSIDFFKRLQTDTGGIRGGIESSAHPKRGETSWQESLTVMAYAPGPWASYIYAGVAAKAARLMEQYAPEKVQEYRRSALAAMQFAEQKHQEGIEALAAAQAVIEADRALAALELYRFTGELDWHQRFLDALSRVEENSEADYRVIEPLREIAFVYSQIPTTSVDRDLAERLRTNLIQQADRAAELTAMTALGWTKSSSGAPLMWGGGLGSPKVETLLRAYTLTEDERYLMATILGCQFSAGANPSNMTFTTGVGHRNPQHPLIIDQRIMGQSPPAGITVYGPMDTSQDHWMFDVFEDVTTPSIRLWPTVEAYLDVFIVPAINEFTVMESMVNVAYAWGYLSARETQ